MSFLIQFRAELEIFKAVLRFAVIVAELLSEQ